MIPGKIDYYDIITNAAYQFNRIGSFGEFCGRLPMGG
jgi:hypothetical protein